MDFEKVNSSKTEFDELYSARTPHRYLTEMCQHGYQIGEQAAPFCREAALHLREREGEAYPIQMLDLGCSYGLGSAFVKYGVSFEEMVSFFASRAPAEYVSCYEAMRNWLNVTPPSADMRVVGFDVSEEAIQFGLDAGLLDGGIVRNLENGEQLTKAEQAWLYQCNLVISTGAIGYLSDKTMRQVLAQVAKHDRSKVAPISVLTCLRMFDIKPIQQAYHEAGLRLVPVPDVYLPQRAFTDEEEERGILTELKGAGINTEGLEDEGILYAALFVGAPASEVDAIVERMLALAHQRRQEEPLFASHIDVAMAGVV